MLVTPQYQTERVLEERATRAGADIRRGSEVTGLTQSRGGVEVKVRGDGHPDRVVRAGWVVGADGMGSLVRQALGLPFPGKPVVRSVMLADVRLAQPYVGRCDRERPRRRLRLHRAVRRRLVPGHRLAPAPPAARGHPGPPGRSR